MKKYLYLLIIVLIFSACSDGSKTLYVDIASNKIYSRRAFEEVEKMVNYEVVTESEVNDTIQVKFKITNPSEEMNFRVIEKLDLLSLVDKKFELMDLNLEFRNDKKIDLEKPTVINFWFTTCYPCIMEMPYLETMKDKYSKKVIFVGITFNDKAEIKRFLNEHNFSFDHITVDKSEISEFGVQSYPTTMFLDKNGIIQNFTNGLNQTLGDDGKYVIDDSDTHIEDEIRKLL
jgi:thiol-disulfide isomerase/thioredoxin